MSLDARDANDVVHGTVSIAPAAQVILDTPYVQRLLELKQLGCSYNAYPCTTHTRKSHSLGVMELCGQMAAMLRGKQPRLCISDMDALCLGIAGMCHDLGHGSFSHGYEAFMRAAEENERNHPEQYRERNERFREETGEDMPPLPDDYEHEATSLTMVDCALARVGLEIDWENLDKPLRQVGDGVDGEKFGVDLGDEEVEPFTSRDWVFIKECIYGKPLEPPHAPEEQRAFRGRETEFGKEEPNKEFLYDIVNNRHNGLDMDKLDYFGRDSLLAYGSSDANLKIFLKEAVVAQGRCPNHKKCFKCKGLPEPVMHLMICYPKKHVTSAMSFFGTRLKNHENIYTHKVTKAAELQMVDLLLEADKHFSMMMSTQMDDPHGFPMPPSFKYFKHKRLPISRAWMHPRLFLRVDDGIIKIVEDRAIENQSSKLDTLRQLLNDRRDRKLYKCVGEDEIETDDDELWKLPEHELKLQLLACQAEIIASQGPYTGHNGETIALDLDDMIVEKRTLHYGRGSENPVSQMRFLVSKTDQRKAKVQKPEGLPIAEEVQNPPTNTPSSFLRRTIRVFCRKPEKHELAQRTFLCWIFSVRENPNCVHQLKAFKPEAPVQLTQEEDDDDGDEVDDQLDSQPQTQDEPLTQDDCGLPSPRKRKEPDSRNPRIFSGAAKKLQL